MSDQFRFRGEVVTHPQYYEISPDREAAEDVFAIFCDYWSFGFDPEVGLDTPLYQPHSIQDLSVCHAHLKPGQFSGNELRVFKKRNPTKECWDRWAQGEYVPGKDAPSRVTPESDEWIIYCVDEKRNACLLAHVQADAHDACKNGRPFLHNIMVLAEQWFSEGGRYPMEFSELAHVFDEKWLAV